MKIPGVCRLCHVVRQVEVTGQAVAISSARLMTVEGVCDICSHAEEMKVLHAKGLHPNNYRRDCPTCRLQPMRRR